MKYRHSRYKGCKLCKSYKAGWSPRFKAKEQALRDAKAQEAR